MNYVVQTGPGASKEDRSRGLGSISPGRSGGRFHWKKLVIFLRVFVMAVVAAAVLSFTMGTLRSSQSSKAAGLCLSFRKMGSAMMSLSAASIEGPRSYWAVRTSSMRRLCLMAWLSSFVRSWRSAFRWSHCAPASCPNESTLKKKHNAIAIAYHQRREAQAAGIVRIAKENGATNLADLFTKLLAELRLRELSGKVLW